MDNNFDEMINSLNRYSSDLVSDPRIQVMQKLTKHLVDEFRISRHTAAEAVMSLGEIEIFSYKNVDKAVEFLAAGIGVAVKTVELLTCENGWTATNSPIIISAFKGLSLTP